MPISLIFEKAMHREIDRVKRALGFTLIEMIVAIVVSSILAIGLINFIDNALTGYDSAASRNKLAQSARIAIDRLNVELHNSLPNSLRVTAVTASGDQCLEFVPVRAATTYVNPPFDAAGTSFDVIQFSPNLESVTEGYVAIYPTRVNEIYDAEHATISGFPVIGAVEAVASILDTVPGSTQLSRITLVSSHRFSEPSPSNRLFFIDQPVSYCVTQGRLIRYTGYGFYDVQTATEAADGVCVVSTGGRCLPSYTVGGSKMLIAEGISNAGVTAFSLSPQTLARNALVSIEFNMSSQRETVRMNHQVLTRSVP